MPAGGIMIANKQQWIRAGQKYGYIQEFLGGKSGQAELAKFHASQPAQLTTGQSAQQGRQQSAA
jgi:hypothetical protein